MSGKQQPRANSADAPARDPGADKAVGAPAKVREPSERETAAIAAAAASQLARPSRASLTLKADPDGAATISNPHANPQGWAAHLTETFGTSSAAFANLSMARVFTAASDRQRPVTEAQANAALALMGAIAPRDELEAAVGEQIIAAHIASLDFLARARSNAGEYRDTAVAYVNAATKLSRTMGGLVETLAKLRSGGRQRIEVIYVNGPAVIGDNAQTIISAGGGDGSGNVGQSHAPGALPNLAAATGLPMRGQDPERDAMPLTRREGPEPLPDARWQEPRRAEGQG